MSSSPVTTEYYHKYKTYIIMLELVPYKPDLGIPDLAKSKSPAMKFLLDIIEDDECERKLADDEILDAIERHKSKTKNLEDRDDKSRDRTPFDLNIFGKTDIKMAFHSAIPFWRFSDRRDAIDIVVPNGEPGKLSEFPVRRFLNSVSEKYNTDTFIVENLNQIVSKYKYNIRFLYQMDNFVMPIDIDPELGNNGDGG